MTIVPDFVVMVWRIDYKLKVQLYNDTPIM